MSVMVKDTKVYATEQNKFKKTGAVIHTCKETADHLVKKGMATTEAPEGSTTKKEKK